METQKQRVIEQLEELKSKTTDPAVVDLWNQFIGQVRIGTAKIRSKHGES